MNIKEAARFMLLGNDIKNKELRIERLCYNPVNNQFLCYYRISSLPFPFMPTSEQLTSENYELM